jgi:hypothetical protein
VDIIEKWKMNKNSAARIAANNKYNEKAYDRINIAIPKGEKEKIKAHAESRGESVNAFITRAINESIVRDENPTFDGYYIYSELHNSFLDRHFDTLEEAEKDMEAKIALRKMAGLPHNYVIYKRVARKKQGE